MNRIAACLFGILIIVSCKNDDSILPGVSIPPRSLTEVAVDDDATIRAYLETHFYNYEEFENPPANFDFKIKFDTILGNEDPAVIPMIDQVQSVVINQASSIFGRDDGEEVDHTLYYLEAREGASESPTIGDNAILHYEGSLFDGRLFDASSSAPLSQYLSGGLIRGYAAGVEKLSAGIGPVDNGDGTVSFTDYGVGAIFIPSGLAYFSRNDQGIIPAYTPIIFKIDLLSFVPDTDFDGDGIPSILEDVNGDGNLNNDNTDSELEPSSIFLPNHNDTDDDGDGIPTIEEIELDDEGNFVGFKDTDGDGTPDHLDSDS